MTGKESWPSFGIFSTEIDNEKTRDNKQSRWNVAVIVTECEIFLRTTVGRVLTMVFGI